MGANPLYFIVATVVVYCCISPAVSIGEDAILNFLEEVRVRMCHPIPKLGLPALDPLEIADMEYQMNNQYVIDFTGSINDFELRGLSDFVVNNLKITTVPLRRSTVDVSLPLTAFKSIYTAKGSLANILNLSGDGNAEASVKELRIAVSWIFRTGLYLGIRDLTIKITVNNININFENLIEEERINEFFHALINELGLELLDDVWKEENKFVEEFVQLKINNVLGKYTLSDIIKIIGGGGGGDGPIFGPDDPPGDCKD